MYKAYIENYIKYIHIALFWSKHSAWLFASFCIEIEKKKKSSSVHRQSHEHRQKEPPTTPPIRTTIYMTNGHPDRAWNRHLCFDIFCFVPFRYIRFAKLRSLPVFVYISFCFVPFHFVSVNFVLVNFFTFHFVSRFISHFTGTWIKWVMSDYCLTRNAQFFSYKCISCQITSYVHSRNSS